MAALNDKRKEISPAIPSGMPKMKGYIAMGMIGLTAVYFAFVYALKDSVSETRFMDAARMSYFYCNAPVSIMGGRNELHQCLT